MEISIATKGFIVPAVMAKSISASKAAQAVNDLLHFGYEDSATLLQVIEDYFDSEFP